MKIYQNLKLFHQKKENRGKRLSDKESKIMNEREIMIAEIKVENIIKDFCKRFELKN